MDIGVLQTVVQVTVFVLMLSIGVSQTPRTLSAVLREPKLAFRALLAVVVLVPVVVGVLIWLFDLPAYVATALAVLAAAPGAPLMTKRAGMAGGDPTYTSSLQLTLALLAVVVTPITVAIFYRLFRLGTDSVPPMIVARQVATVTFLPVVLGLLFRHFLPKPAKRIRKPLSIFANVLFLVLVMLLVVALATRPQLRQMLHIGPAGHAAIAIMVLASIAIGHLLGGPDSRQRASLATACIARNVGLALYVLGLDEFGQQSIPTVLVYMLMGALLAIPYAVWIKRRHAEA